MRWEDYEVPEDLRYHKEHTWLRLSGDEATMGLTDFAQKLAGDINYFELPEPGTQIVRDKRMGSVETGKWVGKLYGPLDGEITEWNNQVINDARLVNREPYTGGWILKIRMADPAQATELLTASGYVETMKKKKAELKMK